MLFHNFDDYNFWSIYDSIKSYYSIGIYKPEQNVFGYYPGTQTLLNIIKENVHDKNNFEHRWLSFVSSIEKHTYKKVLDTTYGQAPSFSCVIELECSQQAGIKRIKELHLFVSLVGPFYCVIGKDRNEIDNQDGLIRSTNYLMISPAQTFSDIFLSLCQLVENQFPSFRFVPFHINKMEIKGIQIPYAIEKREAVFHALFYDQLSITEYAVGNEYFQFERWKTETAADNENNSWTIGPPQKT